MGGLDPDIDPDEPPGYNDAAIFDIYSRPIWPLGFWRRRRMDRSLSHVARAVHGNLTRVPIKTLYSER